MLPEKDDGERKDSSRTVYEGFIECMHYITHKHCKDLLFDDI